MGKNIIFIFLQVLRCHTYSIELIKNQQKRSANDDTVGDVAKLHFLRDIIFNSSVFVYIKNESCN